MAVVGDAEFEIGFGDFGASAGGAAVEGFFGGGLGDEFRAAGGGLVLEATLFEEGWAEEEEVVEETDGDGGFSSGRDPHEEEGWCEEADPGEPFEFEGDDEEEEDLVIGLEGGGGEENGEIEEKIGTQTDVGTGEQESREGAEEPTAQVKEINPKGAPGAFEQIAQKPEEKKCEENPEGAGRAGNENPGEKTPDFSGEDPCGVEREHVDVVRGEQLEDVNERVEEDDVADQAGDGVASKAGFEAFEHGGSEIPQEMGELRGVELGFEQEGIVAFFRMDGAAEEGNVCGFQFGGEEFLFFGIKADIGIDGEEKEADMAQGAEEIDSGGDGVSPKEVEVLPGFDDAEVGIGIEALDKFGSLMQHVGFLFAGGSIGSRIGRGGGDFCACAFVDGVEADEGFVGDDSSQGESGGGGGPAVVISALEVRVVLNGEDLLEIQEALEVGDERARGDGNHAAHFVGMARCQFEGEESADRTAYGGMET